METYITSKDILIAISLRNQGNILAMERDIRAKAMPTDEEILAAQGDLGSQVCTYFDPIYPEDFPHLTPPPFVFYFRGDISLIRNKYGCVSIVGAREAGEYAMNKTRRLARALARRGFTIVSGLAKGIDTAALEAALPYGKACAVIGNGMDYFYPPENRELQEEIAKRGLLISEYPKDTPPYPMSFVSRNRLIAGLSQVVVVAEARIKSGSLITAAFASAMGHEVGAFPHNDRGDNGDNLLIKDGAFLVEDEQDIKEVLGSKAEPFFRSKK